ncbi:MAG TPA: ABC transporter substrate-binding protein [Vicinamibacteria bacterium]|nr:ABC transporter substrate-binding protein [Vicinamibacteria bacterium]
MRRRRRWWAAAVLLACALPAGAATPPPQPRRIASLNLSADEMLVEMLPPERLIAVTRFADEAGTSNVVGRAPAGAYRFAKADLERLVALAPDLVVVSEYTDADFLRAIERSRLRYHRLIGLGSPQGVRTAILALGRAVGAEDRGLTLVARYDRVLGELQTRLTGVQRPRVLYWSGGMTAGADTAIGALIETAGAVNLGRELGVKGIAPPGAERAFAADPDLILVGSWPGAEASVRDHPLLAQTRAVRLGRILVMPNALLVALSQYTADACWHLAHLLHPERVPRPRP